MKRHPMALLSLLLVLALTLACSRRSSDSSATNDPQNAATTDAANSPSPDAAKSQSAQVSVPPGTAVTVRLQTSVSSAKSQTGETFDAVLDEPLVVGGRAVVPPGAAGLGKNTVSKHSGRFHQPGGLGVALGSAGV